MIEILLGSIVFTGIVMMLATAVMVSRALLVTSVPITVSLNSAQSLQARTGSKLLDVLLRAGIRMPAACGGAGTCGLCRVLIEDGGGEASPTEMARFTRKEINQGARLACQVTLHGDLTVRVPDAYLTSAAWECTVRSARILSSFIKEVVLQVPPAASFDFRAGAFVQVAVPPVLLRFADFEIAPEYEAAWRRFNLRDVVVRSNKSVVRAYSIANKPSDNDCIVLLVRLALPPPSQSYLPPGIGSSYLFSLRAGDGVNVSGPYGDFAARSGDREMVFIGGGVGMAPLRAIIFDQLERLGTKRRISFWYGARSRADLFYSDEFERVATKHRNFNWIVALSDPAPDDAWDGPVGFIHDIVQQRFIKAHPAPEECEYYLCGPPLMIKAVLAVLADAGVDEESIFNDDFGS